MRLIKELLKPGLKCERLGHNDESHEVVIRKKSIENGKVASDYKAKILKCRRCKKIFLIGTTQEIGWYSSVTMPDYMWDKLRDNKFLIMRYLK